MTLVWHLVWKITIRQTQSWVFFSSKVLAKIWFQLGSVNFSRFINHFIKFIYIFQCCCLPFQLWNRCYLSVQVQLFKKSLHLIYNHFRPNRKFRSGLNKNLIGLIFKTSKKAGLVDFLRAFTYEAESIQTFMFIQVLDFHQFFIV